MQQQSHSRWHQWLRNTWIGSGGICWLNYITQYLFHLLQKKTHLSTHHCFSKFYSMYAAKKLEAFRKINLSVSLLISQQTWYWWVAMISIQYTGQWCWTGFSLNIVHCSSCASKLDDKRVGCALAARAFAWYCNHKSCHTHTHTHSGAHTRTTFIQDIWSFPLFWPVGLLISAVTNTDRLTDNSSTARTIWVSDNSTRGLCVCENLYVCAFMCHCVWTVCVCGIQQQYQLQSVVHFSLPSPNHHSHLILRESILLSFFSLFHFFFLSLLPQLSVLTGYSRDQSEGSEYSECPQSLDIEACRLPSNRSGAVPLSGLLQDRTE